MGSSARGLWYILRTWAVALLLVLLVVPPSQASAITRDINIVYDNSGSMMYGDAPDVGGVVPQDTWSKALYALNVVAAMVGEESTVKVYDISDAGDAPFLTIVGTDSIDQRVDSIAQNWGYKISTVTSKAHVEAAYADLARNSSADQKWLVVITDGNFEDQTPEGLAQWFLNGTADYPGLADSGINVVYMTIGDPTQATPLSGDFYGDTLVALSDATELMAGGHIYQISAVNTADILADMQLIVNFMLGRHSLPVQDMSYDGQTLTFHTTVAMKDLVVFAQGNGVTIGSLQDAGGKPVSGGDPASKSIQHAEYTEAGNDDLGMWASLWDGSSTGGWYYTIDTSLFGCVASYKGFGQEPDESNVYTYTIPVGGVASASDISIYYLPDVYPVVVFTDQNGVVQATFLGKDEASQDEKSLPVGTYTVELQLWDAVTDVPIEGDSVKMSGQTIVFTKADDPDNPIVANPDNPEVSFGQQSFSEVKVSATILDDTNVEFSFTDVQTMIYVPDWQGCTFDTYAAMLERLGLSAAEGDHSVMADDPGGSQDKAVTGISGAKVGDSVDEGSVITVDFLEPYVGVSIPDVTGMGIEDAEAAIEAAGLVASRQAGSDEASDMSLQGVVYDVFAADDPSLGVGAQVKQGSAVQLTYYASTRQVTVPDVTGMGRDDALAALEAEGFGFLEGGSTPAPDVSQAGLAYGQNPAAGSAADSGSTVEVDFYSVTDVDQVQIPGNLFELTFDDAVDALASIDLAGVLDASGAGGQPAGAPEEVARVYAASVGGDAVAPGDSVDKGSQVDLGVHQGILMPDVTDMAYAQAAEVLEGYGLTAVEPDAQDLAPATSGDECLMVYEVQTEGGDLVAGGDVVPEGARLTLFHHATVQLPEGLVGSDYADACEALSGLGLVPQAQSDLRDATDDGSVSKVYEVSVDGKVLADEGNPDIGQASVACGSTVELGYYANMLELEIPSPDGLSYLEYQDLLAQVGFVAVTAAPLEAPDIQTAELGSISGVSPAPGTVCPVTTPVTVEYYDTYATVAVPDLAGLTKEGAAQALGESLVLDSLDNAAAAPVLGEEFLAFESQPAAGAEVPVGSTVTVSFYGEAEAVRIPEDVWGMQFAEAQALLQGEGLGLVVADGHGEAAADPADEGKVTAVEADGAQIDASTPVKRGSSVLLVHYEGFAEVAVPDVAGLDLDEARALLSGAPYYFDVAQEAVEGDRARYGQIPFVTAQGTDQDGKELPVGSAVAVRVVGDYETVSVPDLTGLTAEEASARLDSSRLTPGRVEVGSVSAMVDDALDPQGEGHAYEWSLDEAGVDEKGRPIPAFASSGEAIVGAPVDVVVYDSYVAPLVLAIEGPDAFPGDGITGQELTVRVTREGEPMPDEDWSRVVGELDGFGGNAPWIVWSPTKGPDSSYTIKARATGLLSLPGIRLIDALVNGRKTVEINPETCLFVNSKGQNASTVGDSFSFSVKPFFNIVDIGAIAVALLIVGIIVNRIVYIVTRKKLGQIIIRKTTRYYRNPTFTGQPDDELTAAPVMVPRAGFEGSFFNPLGYHQLARDTSVTVGDGFRFGPLKIMAKTNSEAVVTNAKSLKCGATWTDLSQSPLGRWNGALRQGSPVSFVFRSDGLDGNYIEVLVTVEHKRRGKR